MMMYHLQPEQTSRILALPRSNQSNAVVYIVIVLLLYATALVVIMVRYLKRERDESRLSHLYHEFVRLDMFRRRKKTRCNQQQEESTNTTHVIVTIATNKNMETGGAEAITHV
jgi:hypothetical protein